MSARGRVEFLMHAPPISKDLRGHVIATVAGGRSRRAAAARFGVAAASAIRWVREWHATGATCAERQGGNKRSHRIEGYRDIISLVIERQVDITLVELAEFLRQDHDAAFAISTILRFLDRHAMTVKTYGPPRLQGVLFRWQLTGLHQRIRHSGRAVAEMESRASQAS